MNVINVEVGKYTWRIHQGMAHEFFPLGNVLASGVFEDGQTVINYQKVKSDSFTALVLLLVEAEINGDI